MISKEISKSVWRIRFKLASCHNKSVIACNSFSCKCTDKWSWTIFWLWKPRRDILKKYSVRKCFVGHHPVQIGKNSDQHISSLCFYVSFKCLVLKLTSLPIEIPACYLWWFFPLKSFKDLFFPPFVRSVVKNICKSMSESRAWISLIRNLPQWSLPWHIH